jgi:hypothetical protein
VSNLLNIPSLFLELFVICSRFLPDSILQEIVRIIFYLYPKKGLQKVGLASHKNVYFCQHKQL